MRPSIGKRHANYLLAFLIALAVWKTLTLVYPPYVVPKIGDVAKAVWSILRSGSMLGDIWLTALRLLTGLGMGIFLGAVVGLTMGKWRRWHDVARPLLGLVQAVPPVSWLVLALIWFGFDGRASIFIVAVSVFPIIAVNLIEGVQAVDPRLVQVGMIYRFSSWKRLRHIVIPSILPYFRSAVRIAVGSGCKAVVMGEVLTTSNGIGGAITASRLNIEPEGVIAWTIMLLGLYFVLDRLAARLLGQDVRPC